ncbi:hypothetical protein GN244_ATG04002 [Phytophthora infestans]|uniref:Transmembrane protein n=1 Tax=Phytophthora infestans TaxID=4787 RepID=A0A833T7J6_PHYIN|nr:hypothetical protein GN244_ATG04002 [Phytophthora infestans]
MDEQYVKSNRSGELDHAPYAAHVDTTAPSAPSAPGTGNSFRTWSTGLFGCFTHPIPNCAVVTLCPCISVARVASKLEVMEKFSAKFRLTPYWFALFSSFVVVVGHHRHERLKVVWGYIKYKYNHWGEDSTWYIYLILAAVCYALFSLTV